MKGHWIVYSDEEMAWLEENRLMVISAYHEAFCAKFGREDVSLVNLHALRKRKGWKTGRTGCFEKGEVPHNKGVPCPEGKGGRHPNARKTQFKKGALSGRARAVVKPIGFERFSKEGYVERKINNDLPFKQRWRAVHLIRWEQVHGPIPAGHALKCLDGDRTNTDPSNWEAIPRGMLPYLNGGRASCGLAYDGAEVDVRPVLMTVARLKHAAKQRRKPSPSTEAA